jgi:thioredoxin reductase (NADPH)
MTKPIILTVDDDPEVLGAIERDLRHKYRADYRVVKASSGHEALEAVQQLKQRGTPVALFLADQRMPVMSGTEFLAEARKFFPDAKKVLLTAYADTAAAIESINQVGLDHYLMKPWDPPDQKLYPVLDELLESWSASARIPFDGIRVAGARWSAQSHIVKEFLSLSQVPYQWIDIDDDAPTREVVETLTGGTANLPVVLFPDGSHLIAPSTAALAAKMGMQTKAQLPFYDVVVIGAGPAGLAAAVYGASEGLKTLVIEQDAPGGQAGTSSRIENYLGFPTGISGADLANRAVTQAKRFGAELLTAQLVVAVKRNDPYRIIELGDGTEISCKAVVIASGMSVHMLDVPGAAQLHGIGVYYGAALTEAATYRGKNIVVVGGANSAAQGAMFFSRYARHVTMLIRANDLGAAMSQYLVDRVRATENITVRLETEVVGTCGATALEQVMIRSVVDKHEEALDASAMFIFIGSIPRSSLVQALVDCDDKGFIITGPDLPKHSGRPRGWNLDRDPFLNETNVPGIFAVGDVRSGASRRVAAAVGEGSAVILMVHRYLETV